MPNNPSSARIRSSLFGPNRWRSSRPFCSCWQVKGNVHVAVWFIARFHHQRGPGNSPNVLRAVEYGNSIGCKTLALTGRDGGKLGPLAQLNIQVPVPHMGRIEDAHMIVCHMIGYYFMENN